MRRRLIAGLLVAAGLTTAGVAYAEGQPPDPSVASSQAGAAEAGAAKAGRLKAGLLKGAIHGDLLVRAEDGTTRTVTFDRGKVTTITAGSITIERPDGISVSKVLTDRTVFNGTPREQIQPGAAVAVVSSGDTAERVLSKGVQQLEKRKAQLERRKERLEEKQQKRQERLDKRQERRTEKTPSTEPSSIVDDGLETIIS
jgi:hypothetical protein